MIMSDYDRLLEALRDIFGHKRVEATSDSVTVGAITQIYEQGQYGDFRPLQLVFKFDASATLEDIEVTK